MNRLIRETAVVTSIGSGLSLIFFVGALAADPDASALLCTLGALLYMCSVGVPICMLFAELSTRIPCRYVAYALSGITGGILSYLSVLLLGRTLIYVSSLI